MIVNTGRSEALWNSDEDLGGSDDFHETMRDEGYWHAQPSNE
jgi:hypothetical protein